MRLSTIRRILKAGPPPLSEREGPQPPEISPVGRASARSLSGQMVLRWTAVAVLEAVKGFRRLKGHADMPKLVAALRARDQQLGITAGNVA